MGFLKRLRASIHESYLASRRPLAPIEAASRHLCAGLKLRAGYRPSRLTLQKLVFLCEILLRGRDPQASLLGGLAFTATTTGPVCQPFERRLTCYCKAGEPVPNRALKSPEPHQLDATEIGVLNEVLDAIVRNGVTKERIGGWLVSILYTDDGAYYRHFSPSFDNRISGEAMAAQGRLMTGRAA